MVELKDLSMSTFDLLQVRYAQGSHRLQAERGQPQEGRGRQPDIRRASNQRDLNVIYPV